MSRYLDMKKAFIIIFCIAVCARLEALPLQSDSCSHIDSIQTIELELAKMLEPFTKGCTIIGVPQIIDCSYGKAVQFDGQDDAMILDTNLLVNMRQFTIEVIMRPDTNGQREQRFLHFGEVRGERVMVETRLTKDDQWYLDTYMRSGQTGQTLADSTKLHLLNQWYHVAFVVNDGKIETYVNGRKELEGQIPFSPFTIGQTSIGVRLNRVNWYKGAIYKIKITPMKLGPALFMKH
ncbi:MAG: LamG domain-containing protein [Bacteroidota bacterium]